MHGPCSYQRNASTCFPCVFGPNFSAQRHVATRGCQYTCRPGLYVDPQLLCNTSCVNMLEEAGAGRIMPRVRDYDGNKARSGPQAIQ